MNPERWKQIEEIFHQASERAVPDRSAYLDSVCGNDSDLRKEVESLLQHDLTEPSMFETLVSKATGSMETAEPEIVAGKRIGPYRVTGLIGAGGMAEVFRAVRDDDQYKSEVAIKLVKRGLTYEFMLKRFRTERQILATLQHPNIAQMLDGGSTEGGLPYFVMTYVDGEPITKYCINQNLPLKKRLELFLSVCDAVQYAHRRLVIHRDLKPSNILVTKDGFPKLLDFGLAKLLSPEEEADTAGSNPMTAARLMTPEYASPEQVRGDAVTTATDVYSLGTVLYEMITGDRAHKLNSRSYGEIERVVCLEDPEKPSEAFTRKIPAGGMLSPERWLRSDTERTRREIKGDLDNIILMSLRKEPARRYHSVEQFSEDIRRHLRSLPVIARHSTFLYRAEKFVKRHTGAVSAAVLVSIALLAGLIGINRQRVRAEERFNQVRKLAHAVVFDYHDAIADLPGSMPVRQRLVKDALTYLDSLVREAKDDRDLQRELASAYLKIGDIQGNSNTANLGDTTAAMASYTKSLELRKKLSEAEPGNTEAQRETAEIEMRMGGMLSDTSKIKNAHEYYASAVTILEPLTRANPADTAAQKDLAEAYFRIGDLKGNPFLPNLGDSSAGMEYHRKAVAILEMLSAKSKDDPEVQASLVNSYRTIAGFLVASGKVDEAEKQARLSVAIAEKMNHEGQESVRAAKAIGNAREILARVLMFQDKWDDALIVFQEILESDRELVIADPRNVQARRYLSVDYAEIAQIQKNQGDLPGALANSRQALSMDQKIAAIDPNDNQSQYDLSVGFLQLGGILAQMRDLAGAEKNQREAVSILEALAKKDEHDAQTPINLALAMDEYSETLRKMGKYLQALDGFKKGIPVGEHALKQDPQNDQTKRQLAIRYLNVADTSLDVIKKTSLPEPQHTQYWRDARDAYRRSLEFLQALQKAGSLSPEYADKPEIISRQILECDKALNSVSNQ